MWVAFAFAKATHFFSKNISIYAIFNNERFNIALTNNTISFEQLGPDLAGFITLLFNIIDVNRKMIFKNKIHVVG